MSNPGERKHQSGLQVQNHDQVHLDQCKAGSTATQQEGSGVLHTLPGLRQSLHWGDRQDIECTTKITQETSHKRTHRRLSRSHPCPPTTS